jgi:hypothetical protein
VSGTPPEEGKSYAFPSFGGVPIGRGGFLGIVIGKVSFENEFPSPDSSGNPFYFSFKNKKITTNSGK